MTTNQTIYGVSRELLERLLTDACNENWSDLNELLHSPSACRCKRFGKNNPHWPCPVHTAPTAQPQGDTVTFPRELSDELAELIAEKARVCGGGAFDIWEAICEKFGKVEQPAPVAGPDALSTGFYTTESGGGKYAINIGFRSMADMQAADAQFRELLKSR